MIEISAEAVTAWATTSLALLTAILAVYTAMLYRESRRLRLERVEPNVIVNIEQTGFWGFFELVIENLGPGSAYDVKITPPARMKIRDQTNFDRSPIYSIKFMKPGSAFRTVLGAFDDISPHELQFSIACTNVKGEKRVNEYTINISHFKGLSTLGDNNPAQSISDALKKIEEHLGKLTRGWSRIKVGTYDHGDRQREAAERDTQRQAHEQEAAKRQNN